MEEGQLLINGRWVQAADGGRTRIFNPSTGQPIGTIAMATPGDVDAAVQAARRAFDDGRWCDLTPGNRAKILWRLADLLDDTQESLAQLESLNQGKPIRLTRGGDLPTTVDNARFFASAARHLEGRATQEYDGTHTSMLRREPIGVVASITPWNYPLMMAVWEVLPALAAGNTVVLKPATATPFTSLALGRLALEAGVPDGVLNIVVGPGGSVGQQLASHPGVDMVSVTGGVHTGSAIMEEAAPTIKRLHFELGGKAPFIVFADANFEAAVQGAVVAAFINAGQDCTAATRIFVERSCYAQFVDAMTKATTSIQVGDALDPNTEMGPVISHGHRERIASFVDRAVRDGATVLAGGKSMTEGPLAHGYYYPPTLLVDVDDSFEVCRQEIFGPVVPIMPFADEEEVVMRSNAVPYGLSGSVWTTNGPRSLRMARKLKMGTVWINDHLPLVSEMPHGGYKQSGFGKGMSIYSVEDYTEIKHVMADLSNAVVKPWHEAVFLPKSES
ncbi:MAG: gamma-aminobutyraldehyde dehydrogenase [Sulfobacillus benefaciens]|uniref:3-sulfolactaldehyde dehydrogenase n=1 Tax=Sulfobacillus benefaciens TaxID=453960 RepID=A0A2T2XDW6_9FIRM|nr:MAG: gamma-aminobutyraldehyde dehydrogenase [Sulfobacillus benefaciens]